MKRRLRFGIGIAMSILMFVSAIMTGQIWGFSIGLVAGAGLIGDYLRFVWTRPES